MFRSSLSAAALALLVVSTGFAAAKSTHPLPIAASDSGMSGSTPDVAKTGKRMPKLGEPKAGKETQLDRAEQQKMDRDMTICKGC